MTYRFIGAFMALFLFIGDFHSSSLKDFIPVIDSPEVDLIYPITNTYDPTQPGSGLIDFEDPLNIENSVEYDPVTGMYFFNSFIGDSLKYRNSSYMTFKEYLDYKNKQSMNDFWQEKVDEQTASSNIGSGDNKVNVADASDEEDPEGGPGVEQTKLGEQLNQYKQAVRFLKDKLHEVNILNAKLLFTNKLFKGYTLDNNQKLKVVENFDRAQTTREIKLVYATLCEGFTDNTGIKRKRRVVESASAKSGSTKPKRKIINEEQHVANRFKKLAGIIK